MAIVGMEAPDFELVGADRKTYKLSDYRGRPVVVAFYRGDDTAVCNRQLNEYNQAYVEWREMGVDLLGISPDAPESHFLFGCRLDLVFPLLSDEDKSVAKKFKVPLSLVGYGRSTFVLDTQGVVKSALRPRLAGLLSYPSADDVTEELKKVLGNT